jgi:hypothetical protein
MNDWAEKFVMSAMPSLKTIAVGVVGLFGASAVYLGVHFDLFHMSRRAPDNFSDFEPGPVCSWLDGRPSSKKG